MAISSEKFTANYAVTQKVITSTALVDAEWLDLSNYEGFTAIVTMGNGASLGLTTFKIIANTASDGSGTDVTVKTHALGTAVDAIGDFVVLSVTAQEVADAAAGVAGYRYVSAQIDAAGTTTPVFLVTSIRGPANAAKSALTADTIA